MTYTLNLHNVVCQLHFNLKGYDDDYSQFPTRNFHLCVWLAPQTSHGRNQIHPFFPDLISDVLENFYGSSIVPATQVKAPRVLCGSSCLSPPNSVLMNHLPYPTHTYFLISMISATCQFRPHFLLANCFNSP